MLVRAGEQEAAPGRNGGLMNEQIFETVVSTVARDGRPHIAPMGVRYAQDGGDGGAECRSSPRRRSTTSSPRGRRC